LRKTYLSLFLIFVFTLSACMEDEPYDDEFTDTTSGAIPMDETNTDDEQSVKIETSDEIVNNDSSSVDQAETADEHTDNPVKNDSDRNVSDSVKEEPDETVSEPDENPQQPDEDAAPKVCEEVTVKDVYASEDYAYIYFGTPEWSYALPGNNLFKIEFEGETYGDAAPQTYDLGSDKNLSYKTCKECVLVYKDIYPSTVKEQIFFPESGTLIVEEVEAGNYGNMTGKSKGRLENLKLTEISLENSQFKRIENGDCILIKSAEWNTFPEE